MASPSACGCHLAWLLAAPLACSTEIVEAAKLRKRDHENITGGNCGATTLLFLDHTLIFRLAFHLRVIRTTTLYLRALLTSLPRCVVLGVSYSSTSSLSLISWGGGTLVRYVLLVTCKFQSKTDVKKGKCLKHFDHYCSCLVTLKIR